MYFLRFFILTLFIAVFAEATVNNNNVSAPKSTKIPPKTYSEIKELIDKSPGKTNRDAWEIVQCISVFEINGLPIDEMYQSFCERNPSASLLDFYEHLISEIAPAITANSIKYSKEMEPFYFVLRIKSSNIEELKRIKNFQDQSQIIQFCGSFGVFVEGKLMREKSLVAVCKNPKVNTFSGIIHESEENNNNNNNNKNNNIYAIYYISSVQDLPSNFIERNNLARKAVSEVTGLALL